MNKLALALASAVTLALGAGTVAYAESVAGPAPGGDVTRAEVEARTTEAFKRMDANHDGVLDKADREAHRAERQEMRFEQLDTNSDGAISRAEFDQARERFAALRGDGDRFGKRGFGGREGPGGPHGMIGPGMFGADADGNKAITEAEFTAAALERFVRADTDRDGTVTAGERRAAMKAFRDQRRAARATDQS